MKIYGIFMLIILSLFQVVTDAVEVYQFILIFFGIIALIIILIYILLTSKQE